MHDNLLRLVFEPVSPYNGFESGWYACHNGYRTLIPKTSWLGPQHFKIAKELASKNFGWEWNYAFEDMFMGWRLAA